MYSGEAGEAGNSEYQEDEDPRLDSVTQGFPDPEWNVFNVIPGME